MGGGAGMVGGAGVSMVGTAGAATGAWNWAWADPSTPKNATMVKPATSFPLSLFIK
jgi:hypothetical protein